METWDWTDVELLRCCQPEQTICEIEPKAQERERNLPRHDQGCGHRVSLSSDMVDAFRLTDLQN